MGILDWLFQKSNTQKSRVPNFTLSFDVEKVKHVTAYDTFSGQISGVPIRAEVPRENKAKCDKLLKNPNRTGDDDLYLHDNYWVNVYYKSEHYGYNGISDLWTHSARELPELAVMHEWIYSILGKKKAKLNNDIITETTRTENGTIYVYGTSGTVNIHLSFKPRGFILGFIILSRL